LMYQNEDGGFGHGLEFDCQNPNSSLTQTLCAYDILKDLNCVSKQDSIIIKMINFFENNEYITEKGCYCTIPSNNHYPCCPWYLFSDAPFDWAMASENYTNNAFIDFVFENFTKDSELYKKALRIIDYRLSVLPDLATVFSIEKSDIMQSFKADDRFRFIKILENYNLKSHDECEMLLHNLLEVMKNIANPIVYKNFQKNIRLKNDVNSDELDEVVDNLCNNKDWSTDGLKCDNPEKKMNEMSSLGYLWWPIYNLIDQLKLIKNHGRLEI